MYEQEEPTTVVERVKDSSLAIMLVGKGTRKVVARVYKNIKGIVFLKYSLIF